MPELPEVETTRLSLMQSLKLGDRLKSIHFFRDDLRNKLPKVQARRGVGQALLGLHRRAKYLIFEFESFAFVTHLGMTGTWRLGNGEPKLHDHIEMNFFSGAKIIYNDPRRFGYFDMTAENEAWSLSAKIKELGPEPLSSDFNVDYLSAAIAEKRVSIKAAIMDQKLVVGVGNIYASEALFRAKIKPMRPSHRLRFEELVELHKEIGQVLREALEMGGSSISDFKDSQGQSGYFQNTFLVYDRAGEKCRVCGSTIKSKYLGGRNSFWCPRCQR